jgi:hypothetical protein
VVSKILMVRDVDMTTSVEQKTKKAPRPVGPRGSLDSGESGLSTDEP